ncbi:TPA: hypothetical protein ACH3X2_008189 [Trebouxia sp. C0005]
MVQTHAQFKLDVHAQKDQGIYNNTTNSLTGASASSSAIHYATALETNNAPTMRGYKARGSHGLMPLRHKKKGRKSTRHTESYSVHGVRYHTHKAGTKRRKYSGYYKCPYASKARKLGAWSRM